MDDSVIKRMYPEGELRQAQLALPLGGPRVATSTTDIEYEGENSSTFAHGHVPPTDAQRRKHESYTLTGSVFLVAGNGKTLKLPAPSSSPADPLGWSRWKRAGVALTVSLFSIVSLAVAQAAGLFLRIISREFDTDVAQAKAGMISSSKANFMQDIEPWRMDTLVTTPTLFMAVGAVVWIPLTIGMGRRPVFLLASLTTFMATLGASFAQNFSQLLACVCFLGLGEGFALTAVCPTLFLRADTSLTFY